MQHNTLFSSEEKPTTFILAWSTGSWKYFEKYKQYDPLKFLNRSGDLILNNINAEDLFDTVEKARMSKIRNVMLGQCYIFEVSLSKAKILALKHDYDGDELLLKNITAGYPVCLSRGYPLVKHVKFINKLKKFIDVEPQLLNTEKPSATP